MDYEKISVAERVRRTIEAAASRDFAEIRKLTQSCPKETVEITNLEYLNTSRMLMRAASLFELEVRGLLLNITAAQQAGQHDVMLHNLKEIASVKVAWEEFCDGYDLEPSVLVLAAGGHHPIVSSALQTTLDADPESVNQWSERLRASASAETAGEIRH